MPKWCHPTTFPYEERDENHREPGPDGWLWVFKHFSSKMHQEPLCCSCSIWPSTVMKKDNTWRQHSLLLILNKWIKLQHALHFWQETLIVLGMFMGSPRARNWQVQCVTINGHTRDIAQHICAKHHLILPVVVISRTIGHWKKSPRNWSNRKKN